MRRAEHPWGSCDGSGNCFHSLRPERDHVTLLVGPTGFARQKIGEALRRFRANLYRREDAVLRQRPPQLIIAAVDRQPDGRQTSPGAELLRRPG